MSWNLKFEVMKREKTPKDEVEVKEKEEKSNGLLIDQIVEVVPFRPNPEPKRADEQERLLIEALAKVSKEH